MELLAHATMAARSIRRFETTEQNNVDKQLLILRVKEIAELKERNAYLENHLIAALNQLSTLVGSEIEHLPLNEIIKIVAKYFQLTKQDILGPYRRESLVEPRHFAMYLCRANTVQSFTQIGKWFHRDHTTVLYAYFKMKKRGREDAFVCKQLFELEELMEWRLIELRKGIKIQFGRKTEEAKNVA